MGQLTYTTAEVQEILNSAGVAVIAFTMDNQGKFIPVSSTVLEDIGAAFTAGKLVVGFVSGEYNTFLTLVGFIPVTPSQYGGSGYAAFSTFYADKYVVVHGNSDTAAAWVNDNYTLTPDSPVIS